MPLQIKGTTKKHGLKGIAPKATASKTKPRIAVPGAPAKKVKKPAPAALESLLGGVLMPTREDEEDVRRAASATGDSFLYRCANIPVGGYIAVRIIGSIIPRSMFWVPAEAFNNPERTSPIKLLVRDKDRHRLKRLRLPNGMTIGEIHDYKAKPGKNTPWDRSSVRSVFRCIAWIWDVEEEDDEDGGLVANGGSARVLEMTWEPFKQLSDLATNRIHGGSPAYDLQSGYEGYDVAISSFRKGSDNKGPQNYMVQSLRNSSFPFGEEQLAAIAEVQDELAPLLREEQSIEECEALIQRFAGNVSEDEEDDDDGADEEDADDY